MTASSPKVLAPSSWRVSRTSWPDQLRVGSRLAFAIFSSKQLGSDRWLNRSILLFLLTPFSISLIYHERSTQPAETQCESGLEVPMCIIICVRRTTGNIVRVEFDAASDSPENQKRHAYEASTDGGAYPQAPLFGRRPHRAH